MRALLIGGAVAAVLALAATACGGAAMSATDLNALQERVDILEIGELEKAFHRATSTKDVDLMMSLWAPNATFTVGPGQTVVGKEDLRRFWLSKSVAFQPDNNWVSDTPAYKIRITANGDRGTLYFECHYVDPETRTVEVVAAIDAEVARIDGEWLLTSVVAASPTLGP